MARGEHIYINHGVYTHHGIDCGDGTVIHYTGEYLRGIITRTSLNSFASGKQILIQKYYVCDAPDLVIQRAESRLGENQYNLFFNNCEHFACWCKTGQQKSEQVNRATTATANIFTDGASVMEKSNIKQVNPTFILTDEIANKLKTGEYERIGGIIRNAKTKQVVAFLRDLHPDATSVSKLLQLGASASLLNLGVTVMGFAIVNQRLNEIEKRLQKVQEVLNKINCKIDLKYYADFRAAVELVTKAITIKNPETRKSMAISAISELRRTDHIYTNFLDEELEKGSPIIDEYFLTLILSYVTEARCYLELELPDTAAELLQEGSGKFRLRIKRYIELLLTSNPAAYLHPELKGQTDLRRFTQIYQWLEPSLNENTVFEMQRENLYKVVTDTYTWAKSLPLAIYNINDVEWGLLSANPSLRKYQQSVNNKALISLPQTLIKMESIIETFQRFESFLIEIKAMQKLGINFNDWLNLFPTMNNKFDETKLLYITLSEPLSL